MPDAALVYRVGIGNPEYVGKVEFERPLQINRPNWFIHQRQRHVVQVTRIEPANWNPGSETIPSVYVTDVELPPIAKPTHSRPKSIGPRTRSRTRSTPTSSKTSFASRLDAKTEIPSEGPSVEHLYQCPKCGTWFDGRDMRMVSLHEGPLPHRPETND
jgi:hypothetical protein